MLLGAAGELVDARSWSGASASSAEPYRTGRAGAYARVAKTATVAGAVLGLAGRRRPLIGRAGAALVLGGAMAERYAVFRAGFQSAQDPRYTIISQRSR